MARTGTRKFVEALLKASNQLETVAKVRWDIDQSVSEIPTSLLSGIHKSSGAGDTRRRYLEEGSEEQEAYFSAGEENLSSEDEDESSALSTSSSDGMMRARAPGVTRHRRTD